MKGTLSLNVNGKDYEFPSLPGETLADLLRNRLHLTGTKIGCNEAECGACTVIVDGDPVLSCIYPAERAAGRKILTIEGLADAGILHPLQEAFIQYGAVQCGFCTPGQIMVAYALLQRNPTPTSEEIRQALVGTLCRCGGYPSIESAVEAAARALHNKVSVDPPMIEPSIHAQKVIGHSVHRPDALGKVTGTAIYTDDLVLDGMLFAAVKRAGVPHAIVKSIHIEPAQVLPGVISVLTAEDIPGEHNHGLVIYDWPSLVGVGERVRYVGDAVAIVAAQTQQLAEQALDLIEVEYELQPVVSDPVQARQPETSALHENGNLLKHIKVVFSKIQCTGFIYLLQISHKLTGMLPCDVFQAIPDLVNDT